MAVGLLVLLILALAGRSDGTWCICINGTSETELQKTLDYACGAGADCTPTMEGGACNLPNTVLQHCSYAVNSYFQSKGQAAGTCDFSGTATTTTTDPSPSTTCSYPSTASPTGNATAPTPPSGILGLGPSGSIGGTNGIRHGGLLLAAGIGSLFVSTVFSDLILTY